MKQTTVLLALLAILFASCQNDAKLFSGSYSYKTSGKVILQSETSEASYQLTNKIGQLKVITIKSANNDSVLLVMNEMGGSVITLRAKVLEDSIFITPYTRSTFLLLGDSIQGNFTINITGNGIMYDKFIILNEIYDGKLDNDSTETTIHGDNILTVAERN